MIKSKAHAKRPLNTELYTKKPSFSHSGHFLTVLLLIFFSLLNPQTGYSQYANEEELKKQAAQYFEDEDYANGYKAYSQLVSNYPKDANYNYRLGVCMLYTEPDKKKCYTYLEFANKNSKDCEKEVKFYLGKAYHANFRFDDAIKLYTQYKEIASSSMVKKLLVDRQIDACKNGKRLLSNLNELVVLEKKQLVESDYFRSYNLKDIGGKLLVKPTEFITPADKKKKDKSIVYLPKSGDQLYYASYGTGDNKDIFIVRKLPNGQWSKPENIGNAINTPYDEDYPFLHPNGRVLYFASKGHNSMGGYDIFKSEFDEAAGVWGKPVNMDFPINSPNDDILFVTDSLEKTAYFSSARQSPVGKLDVFKINTERRIPEFIFIKGSVLKKVDGQSLASKISVKDIGEGQNVGSFQASVTGSYLAKIPNGGKFIFTVETPGFPTQSEGIDIPVNNSLLPYKQYISYDNQKLVIQNTFETNKDDENGYLDYLEVIEEKSKLDVNASDFSTQVATNNGNNNSGTNNGTNTTNTNSGNNNSTNNTTNNGTQNTNANTNTNMSNQQLEQIAFTDAKELKEESDKLKADANDAFAFVNNQKLEADQKEKEANTVIEQANAEQDLSKKELLLTKANELKEDAKKLQDQASLAENIAKQLDIDANNKKKEAELQQKYAEQLKEVNKSKNNKEALTKLEEIQKEQNLLGEQKSTTNELANSIKLESDRKEEEITKLQPLIAKQKDEVKDLTTEITGIDSEINATKDKGLLENLKAQKEELNNELTLKNTDLKRNEDKLVLLQKESDALKSQSDFASNMLTQVKGNDNITSVSNNNGNTNNGSTNTNNGTNTNSGNNTNTNNGNTTTNNGTTNETALTGIQKDQKVFDDEMVKLNSQPESSGRYEEQNKLVTNYIAAVDKEIVNQKADLKKAKTATEKTAINTKLKELEQNKKDKEEDKKINDSKITYFKNIENNAVVNNGNNNTNNNGIVTNNTNTGTDTSSNNNTATTNTVVVNNNNNSGNNNATNNNTTNTNNGTTTNDNSTNNGVAKTANGDTKEKVTQLNSEADKLSEEATALRKKTAGLTGVKKQENIKKIQDLENQASAKRFDAVILTSKENEGTYATNQKTIDEYIQANGDKNNPEIAKANSLLAEAKTFYNQAMKIEQEANSEPDIAAKTASYSNVEEKELQALQKQEEAVALYKKNNPGFVPTTNNNTVATNNNASTNNNGVATNNGTNTNANNNGTATNTNSTNNSNATDPAVANKTVELQNTAATKKQDYGKVLEQLKANENQANGTNPEIQQKKKEAEQLLSSADELINAANLSANPNEKNLMLDEANQKIALATTQLNEANTLSKQLQTQAANNATNNVATNNSNGNNTATNNSNNGTTNSTNTNSTNNGTTNNTGNNNTSNTGNTTAATNTVVPVDNGKLTPAEIKAIQDSPDYKSFTTLNNEAVKYNDIADKESAKAKNFYEQATNYLKESNDLRIQLDQLPEGDEKKLKQDQAIKLDHLANVYKAKGDSVSELAANTRSFVESKKMEADAFAQSLDKKVYENILIASGNQTGTTAGNNTATNGNNNSGNTTTTNPKYEGYSTSYADNAGKFESDLNTFSSSEENEGNLKGKNIIFANYNKAIDTEIAAQKKKLTTANPADKAKINKRIKDLGTQKTANNNAIASNNTKIKALTQPVVNNTTNNTNNSGNTNNTGTNNTGTNNTNNTTGNNNTTANNNSTSAISTSGIEIKSGNAYSAARPIPIDEKLPNGIIFAVQIGAFKNQIPNDLFKGLSPLRGETTTQGLIRYQAGRFSKFEEANGVKNDIKKLGYRDAFVVVYRDGQRISLGEAMNELKNQGVAVNINPNETAGITSSANIPNANTVANTVANNNGGNNTTTNATNNVPAANVNATELNNVQGMLFTVQIGVYSNEASSTQLYNLKPIYRERLPNGYYRYTAGIYSSLDKVKADRSKVNGLGISDAFVSAYLNGSRIKVADALAKMGSGDNIQFPAENPIQFGGGTSTNETLPTNNNTTTNTPPVNTNTVTTNSGTQPFNNGVSQGPQPTAENGVKLGEEGITFKVQIGAYKNQVPQNVANNWMKIKTWPIGANQVNGLYIYTVGSFANNKAARPLLEEAKANGIADAYITVYKDGKKLYGAEASSYLNQ